MTNAQAALLAATAGVNWSTEQALKRADMFKRWLDEQTNADHEEMFRELRGNR